ncbi:MAG: diphthine synthase, partial [Methanotrichaceae archaeon]|nr:diphthine synthase [Methanotrichaceae archaeon]
MLFFVGLGLHDQRDISVKGLETVRRADRVYAEFYTSRLVGASMQDLEGIYGKKVNVLSRNEVEVNPSWLEEARD